MSLSIRNQDGSYFRVSATGIDLRSVQKDVKSITVTEEEFRLTIGSIAFNDPYQTITDILFPVTTSSTAVAGKKKKGLAGSSIDVEWGYKDPLRAVSALIPKKRAPLDYKGPIQRKGLKGVVISPSGSMGDDGSAETRLQFINAISTSKTMGNQVYNGTRGTIVGQVMLEAGVLTPMINFEGMEQVHSFATGNIVRRSNETPFSFLVNKAKEWGAHFKIGYTPVGALVGLFVDRDKLESMSVPYVLATTKGVGKKFTFEWGRGLKNVISADWKNQYGSGNIGDNVQLRLMSTGTGGQKVIAHRTTAATHEVKTLKLDVDKLRRAFEREKKKGGIPAATKLLLRIMNATQFEDEEIRQYWKAATYKTAPNSAGTTVTIETFGNPLYTPPGFSELGLGFPLFIQKRELWRIRKVDHIVSREGYKCSVEVQDYPSNAAGFV